MRSRRGDWEGKEEGGKGEREKKGERKGNEEGGDVGGGQVEGGCGSRGWRMKSMRQDVGGARGEKTGGGGGSWGREKHYQDILYEKVFFNENVLSSKKRKEKEATSLRVGRDMEGVGGRKGKERSDSLDFNLKSK